MIDIAKEREWLTHQIRIGGYIGLRANDYLDRIAELEAAEEVLDNLHRGMTGPPFDGKQCPMCPMEIRNLYAASHNLLVRWDAWKKNGGSLCQVAEHMQNLRDAAASCQPLLDAHFADRKHSHGPPSSASSSA
jgi:hypothetical protein